MREKKKPANIGVHILSQTERNKREADYMMEEFYKGNWIMRRLGDFVYTSNMIIYGNWSLIKRYL
jgi:hypothetical protein